MLEPVLTPAWPSRGDEQLPEIVDRAGRLFLWPHAGPNRIALTDLLRAHGIRHEPRAEGSCVVFPLHGERNLLQALERWMHSENSTDVRCLFVAGNEEPGFWDFPRTSTLRSFLGLNLCRWLIDLIREDRLTTWFQPIVCADQPDRIFGHEALLRGISENDVIIPPEEMLTAARNAGLFVQLDLRARRNSIRLAVEQGVEGHLFLNFNPTAIADPMWTLQQTVHAIDEGGLWREQVVLEITESDRINDIVLLQRVISVYREAGFKVALDDIGAGYSNLNLIHQLRPDYIKLDMELIRDVHRDPYKAMIAGKLLEIARALGIRTVAEGVEQVEEYEWFRQRGADFVQGFYFARPAPKLRRTQRQAG